MDFDSSHYAPNEWDSAEKLYNAAHSLSPVSMEDYQAAVLQYKDVAGSYNIVISKVMPIYHDSRKAAVQSARDMALAAGAGTAFADEIKAIDDKSVEDEALFEKAEYYEFKTASLDTESRYAVLATRAAALNLKNEIDVNRLARFSQEIYNSANESADKAKVLYNENDIPAAKTATDDALAKYQQSVSDGWKAYAEEQSSLAQAARENVVKAKADIALKKDFTNADAVYSQGMSDYEAQNYKSATDSFVKVQPLFVALAKSAADKQKAASAAIAAAQKKYTDSQNKAQAVPGTTNNQYLTKSSQLLASAQKSLNEGDFDAASASAAEAQKNASLSDAYVAEQKKLKDAVDALAVAKRRIDGVDADSRKAFAAQYGVATAAYADGVKAQSAKNWDTVNADVKKINDALNELDKGRSAALAAAEAKRKADEAAEKKRADDAGALIVAAKNRLDWVVSIGAEQQYTDQYGKANSAYDDALAAQKSKDWDKTTDRATRVIAIVDAIEALKIGEAEDAMSTAKERLDWAVGIGASDNYPDAFTSASASYSLGEKALAIKDWNGAIVAADGVMNALASVSDKATLPAQYTVRTWESVRDCLWNIAGYPWVYNDPFQWRTLYNANYNKLPDINDASSIEPGTIIDIPSIRGETRSGMWEEGKTYTDMPR
jgi:hypothetical protein